MRTFSLAAFAMSLTCFSTIAFLMASRPASGPLTFWAWIRPQRTTLGMGAPSENGASLCHLDRLTNRFASSKDPGEALFERERRVAALLTETRVVEVRVLGEAEQRVGTVRG